MQRIITVVLIFITASSFGQIKIGGGEEEKDTNDTENQESTGETELSSNEEPEVMSDAEIFIGANWSSTNRILRENTNIFGDSLGYRADEKKWSTWSFSLGFRSRINDYLMWQGGVSYLQNGEQYNYSDADSSFHYTNLYSHVGVPIKLYFTYGNKWRLQAGIGFAPQMLFAYKRNTKTVVDEDVEEQEITEKIGFNNLTLLALGSVGTQYEFMPTWSIFVNATYRRQLNSSFLDTNPYLHYGTAIGVDFGFVKAL